MDLWYNIVETHKWWVGCMSIVKQEHDEIIYFLKKHQKNYENNLLKILESSNKGLYFINDNDISFSLQAKKLLNLENNISVDLFYEKINLQDRKKIMDTINKTEDSNASYEVIYRYKIDKDKIIWIKEHGLFSFKHKKQRLAMISNYTKQIENDKKIHRLAYFDNLTNLKNKNYFEQDANFLIQYNVPFALFLLDLNSFKVINDNFGHSLGDNVLIEFTKKLKNSLNKEYDFEIYRFLGDGFIIIFPYIKNKNESKKIIAKIANCFKNPLIIDEYPISVEPNIGISFFPGDSQEFNTLMKYTEISLNKAKEKDNFYNYSFFNYKYYLHLIEEQDIKEYIKQIINEDSLSLHYQPLYNVESNKIIGFEALFSSKSKYNTKQIFDVALKSHLIILLDKHIIEKVIKDISLNNITENIIFTINLTPKTIEFIDVYEYIKQILYKYNVSGNMIGIEITEQYFVNDEKKINELIVKLHSLGIKIYLDDFGMGYSSIRNLNYIAYDNIKLDRRLVSTVFDNLKCQLFIKNIFQFSKEVGCDVIVEGVETKKQLDYLKQLGAIYIQGYYLSKPIEIKELHSLLNK